MKTPKTTQSILMLIALSTWHTAHAQELWHEPQDTQAALTKPDLYAWQLFVALNWPADVPKREADKTRKFGENAVTVWESWKLTSGKNDEVFLKGGANPGPWPGPTREITSKEDVFSPHPIQQLRRFADPSKRRLSSLFDSDISQTGNENHMNQAAYEFVVINELYHVEGQEDAYNRASELFMKASIEGRSVSFSEYRMDFPLAAKEVKAQWRQIDPAKKERYRWAEGKDGKIYGLTSLHITTKDLPNWLWATFEHVDNPSLEGAEGWIIPSRDSSAGPSGFPDGFGIEGTRWQYYRLRGTQTEFTDPIGDPTLLASSQIEKGFQTTSSCITCHARAAIGAREMRGANRLSIFSHEYGETVVGNIGIPEPSLYVTKTFGNPVAGELRYLPLDFVWSFRRAQRKTQGSRIAALEAGPPSYAEDIKPMFRAKDISAMKRKFDLSKYEDVKSNSEEIYNRLFGGSMPCDGPWPDADVELFRRWKDEGMHE